MLRITDFCICMHVFGCKLSPFRLCGSDFGITPVDDITIAITWAAFCFHIAHISFASSRYFFCLWVIVLARLCVFGTAMSIRKAFFVFLLMKVTSSRLNGIVLSVRMLLFQYSLKWFIIIIIIIIIIFICLPGGGTVRMSNTSRQQEAKYQVNGRIAWTALLTYQHGHKKLALQMGARPVHIKLLQYVSKLFEERHFLL